MARGQLNCYLYNRGIASVVGHRSDLAGFDPSLTRLYSGKTWPESAGSGQTSSAHISRREV